MGITVRDEGKKVNSNINVTPMVDVMLVLLIIFMVITPMLQNKVSIDLARVDNATAMPDADKEDAVVVAVTRDGKVFLGQNPVDPAQLGSLPRRHERATAKRVHHRPGLKAQPASKSHGRGNRFGRERQPGVVHELQPCSGPGLANPDRALAERVEQRSDTCARLAGSRREDR